MSFIDSEIFSLAILPVLIFVSRIFDVTLGTIRIIFVSRGNKLLAPILGFFEVIIWILAISQIMKNVDNLICYIAYAGGFATGTYIGLKIEEKLAIGILIVRIILIKDECQLKERLAAAGYGVTVVDAHGINGEVKLIYTIIKRKDVNNVVQIIHKCHSDAFYSVEDARMVNRGIFPASVSTTSTLGFTNLYQKFKPQRKGK